MAKESMKAREVKRAKLVAKYAEKRAALKKIVNSGDPAEAFEAAQKLQAIPKNANLVCVPFHVGKGKLPAFALVIGPQQCGFVGLLGCPGIHYVVAEVEILRYVYLQVLDEVLL